MKGKDAHWVSYMSSAAEDLGYTIYLGQLIADVSGITEAEMERYNQPTIVREHDSSFVFNGLLDLDGNIRIKETMKVDPECLIPREAFLDAELNDRGEDEYIHNEGPQSTIEQFDVLTAGYGMDYMLKQLKQSLSSDSPTAEDKQMASAIVRNLEKSYYDSPLYTMLDYALKWKDVEMWTDIVKNKRADCVGLSEKHGFVDAWRLFGFENIRPGLEANLSVKQMKPRFDLIRAIPDHASESDDKALLSAWCANQLTVALTSYARPRQPDVPFLVSMACEGGIEAIQNLNLVPVYEFLTEFVEALLEQKEAAIAATGNSEHGTDLETSRRSLFNAAGSYTQTREMVPCHIGGECCDCERLNRFMARDSEMCWFHLNNKDRTHLERQMKKEKDLVTYSTFGSETPEGLEVKKTAAVSWYCRERRAQELLETIGEDNIQKIMGPDFAEFVLDEAVDTVAESSTVAGMKRKRM
ncbi:hypothetical protein AX17_004114 [Amanita inopinata Kibby_2008]|nr:hypothetical protein AX17_004114 [Amanita inopinata Kibby_2008]